MCIVYCQFFRIVNPLTVHMEPTFASNVSYTVDYSLKASVRSKCSSAVFESFSKCSLLDDNSYEKSMSSKL